ncbi:MAG: hypothetical protein JXM71_07820, partial [Spirochaetales bacterium]|nr:hypothetical protein [Spirochaetales bacterium]
MKRPVLLACIIALAVSLSTQNATAQVTAAALSSFPDFLKVRAEFLSSAITAAPATALSFKPRFRDTAAGRVRVSVEAAGGSLFVLFLLERDGGYP